MRRFLFALTFCVLCSDIAFAEEPKDAPQASAASKVEVVEDQDAGVVRVLIGGKEVVVIDERGLHVTGDIEYTGVSTDSGAADHAP